ncbi:MAG TPA: serine/threonine-protein kinase [Planctomycetaceae bacterium]|nr:serine/threonine-protein kinase [Planctomycetaceae bacterium]HQZ66252.1 serine/threonine-protein kinase [Planctomycetaceae bacterium]
MPEPTEHIETPTRTVQINGRSRAYLECRRIRRRDYFLLERIGSPFRESYLAFDRLAGPGGGFFIVQSLPAGDAAKQLLRVLTRLKSDNLPRAVEWQQNRHQIDVALTWTEGISLADYLQNLREGRRPPVEPAQAVRLVNGLAHAICHLQRHLQVAHGDIQPANVIVTSHPSRLQLIDFGSAWPIDRTTRRTEGDGHHRCYAAPELQTGPTPVTLAGDQFSLSVLLFELLTLELPYGGLGGKAGRPEFITRSTNTLVAPSQISPSCKGLPRSLRDRLDALVLRGLALNPESRHPDYNTWLNQWKELSALFQITPELTPMEILITRVISWFVKPDSDRKHTGSC